MEYQFTEIEKRWQQYWKEKETYKVETGSSKPKFYVLDMFPYPSGAGLHVGHPLGYIASDIFSRYKRLKGFNVLHPMGYDAFGLPAEQYAIQTGQHPAITTQTNISRYREQLDKIGFSFDWSREVRTCDPGYYKWTQWIFLKLFDSWFNNATQKAEPVSELIKIFEANGNQSVQAACDPTAAFSAHEWKSFSESEQQIILLNYRLAFLSEAMVNWCPALGTVLANEEVKDGVSERGGYPVERKLMKQWSLRISAYAERLLEGLDQIDWSESLKESQRNWIGKSEGAMIRFEFDSTTAKSIHQSTESGQQLSSFVEVFTTRPDTIFGVSFVTLAPEHELVKVITTSEYAKKVDEYIEYAKNRSERERMADVKKITGQFTGAFVMHPFTNEKIPVWVGDYVLAGYGTGAVMAVPGHDSRDYAFARHFSLPVKEVVKGGDLSVEAFESKEGIMVNSNFLDGMKARDAVAKAISEISTAGKGEKRTNYRLRDAVFGRQRYWGEPIPVYYKNGIPYPVPENELPLILPEVDKFLPTENGDPPLGRAKDWKYNGVFEYELTTMPGWAGSSWYYLRYMDAGNDHAFASKEALNYWKEVDLYLGGSEHATGHLLYVRFWTKVLYDLGHIPVQEPAKKLINQGMIQGVSAMALKLTHRSNEHIPSGFVGKNNLLMLRPSDNLLEHYISEINIRDYLELQPNKNVSATSLVDLFNEKSSKLDIPYKLQKENVPVDYVDNGVLDIEKFTQNSAFKDKVFWCQKGYWLHGKFYPYLDFYSKKPVFENIEHDAFTIAPEVEKMSKSKWNVVSPDLIIEQYGADCLRLYEMFLGPIEQSKPWNTNGITGVSGFLRKFWKLFFRDGEFEVSTLPADKKELKVLHKTILKIGDDIEKFSFNTSVSSFMICVNELTDLKCNKKEILEPLTVLLSPFAPHIAEELWHKMGNETSVTSTTFPVFNEAFVTEDEFEYPVSVNGKTRFKITIPLNLSKEEIESQVMQSAEMNRFLEGKTAKKVIVVPGRIVNVVL